MKAAVYYGPRDVRVETVPMPTAGPVRSSFACSLLVCGTTSASFCTDKKMSFRPPSPATKLWDGIRWVPGLTPHRHRPQGSGATVVGCGKCIYCQRKQYNLCDSFTALGYDYAGGFAEYVKIPAAAVAQGNIILVPRPWPWSVPRWSNALLLPEWRGVFERAARDRALVFGRPHRIDARRYPQGRGCNPVIVTDVPTTLAYVEEFGLAGPSTRPGQWHREDTRGRWGEKFDVALTANSVKSTQADALKLSVRRPGCFLAGIPKGRSGVTIDTTPSIQ